MKKFIKKLVADVKFADAGQGHRLNESAPRPSSSSSSRPPTRQTPTRDAQTAGAAALARLEKQTSGSMMKAQQLEMRRQMQRQASEESRPTSAPPKEPEVIQQMGLRMICPICRSSVPKSEISNCYESCLEKQLELEPLKTTCTMIHTLNTDSTLLANGVKTLAFFVQNVANSPDVEKYRKIRVNNPGVQKKIMPLVGGVEFLEIAGFTRIKDDADGEEYFIMLDVPAAEHLNHCVETLQTSVKLTPTLDRDAKVLQPSVGGQRFSVSADFYRVTKEDLLAEQKRRTEENERESVLRTKAMRDRDAGIGMRIYHYAVIRIRFPDGLYLQGTFSAHDTVESLFKFVESSLRHPVTFTLIAPGCPSLKRDSTLLKAAGLVPTGVFNLSVSERPEFTLLSDEMVCKLAEL